MAANRVDHIGALPDEILHHILSFLPAPESVRTCVLARRWRDLWRFTSGIRVVAARRPGTVRELVPFMRNLLALRERMNLDAFEIKFRDFSAGDHPHVTLWIRYAMLCEARTLTVHLYRNPHPRYGRFFYPDFSLLASRRLKTLDLRGVGLHGDDVEFPSCPALENLKISCSDIAVNLSFQSLKHLSITSVDVSLGSWPRVPPRLVSLKLDGGSDIDEDSWPLVSAPCLVSLELDTVSDGTLSFGSMPLLETAFVRDPGNFLSSNAVSSQCQLMWAISNVKHLELMSSTPMVISTWDYNLWPTFSKLKTLLLDGNWCAAPHFSAITCILMHSPVLEKLTLLLFTEGRKHKVKLSGCYNSAETSTISKHLQIVEVKCRVVNEKVLEVLKFLCTLKIYMTRSSS